MPAHLQLLVDMEDPYYFGAMAARGKKQRSVCPPEDWKQPAETPLFGSILKSTTPMHVLEVGCVVGSSLGQLAEAMPEGSTWMQVVTFDSELCSYTFGSRVQVLWWGHFVHICSHFATRLDTQRTL